MTSRHHVSTKCCTTASLVQSGSYLRTVPTWRTSKNQSCSCRQCRLLSNALKHNKSKRATLVSFREKDGFTPVGDSRVWYLMVGGGADHEHIPLLPLQGGPGAPHDYITDMAAWASDPRRVIFYDQLGCGRSD